MRAASGPSFGIVLLAVCIGACADGDMWPDACPSGTENCPCRSDESCDTGLSCVSGTCTANGEDSSGTATDDGSEGSEAATTDGDGSSEGSGSEGEGSGDGSTEGTGGDGSGSGQEPSAVNLVQNGDFGWGEVYWERTYARDALVAESFDSGEGCIYNLLNASTSFSLGYPLAPTEAFSVEAGASYTFSYQVRGEGEIQAKVGEAVEPWNPIALFDTHGSSTTPTTHTHSFVADAAYPVAGVVFNCVLGPGGALCFDNVVLVQD